MNVARAVFEVKSLDDQRRTFEGIATTPEPDRMGDIVEPKGAKFRLPLKMLYQHDSQKPIGHVRSARVTDAGIVVAGDVETPGPDTPPSLRERLDVAWAEMKTGLVGGLSIGFRPLKFEPIKGTDFSVRFTDWEWLELSAVTIGANVEATITNVKRFDVFARAASGQVARKGVELLTTSAGASALLAAHRGAVKLTRRT